MEQRVAKLETLVEGIEKRTERIEQKLDVFIEEMAEARGAMKFGKWIFGIIISIIGGISGWLGGKTAVAAKVAAVAETGIHLVK